MYRITCYIVIWVNKTSIYIVLILYFKYIIFLLNTIINLRRTHICTDVTYVK